MLKKQVVDDSDEENEVVNIATEKLWHLRLGHTPLKTLLKMESAVEGLPKLRKENMALCEGCVKGKMHLHSHLKLKTRNQWKLGELVHTDMEGPMPTPSKSGKRYFITFIENNSGHVWLKFTKHKSEALQAFKDYVAWMENLTGNKVKQVESLKVLRSDNDSNYCSKDFGDLLKKRGITHEKSAPYSQ